MKQLTKEGMGKLSHEWTCEREGTLWSQGSYSLSCGWGLIYALFRYNCKLFGADEHGKLMREYFEVGSDKGKVVFLLRFKGRKSKNVPGGLKHSFLKLDTRHIRT